MFFLAWAGAAMFFLSLVHFLWRYFAPFGQLAPAGAGLRNILIDVSLFSVFALHHSVLARTGAKAWVDRFFPAQFERTLYVWTASLLFIATCAMWRPVSGVAWHLHGAVAAIVWAGQIIGVVFTAWSAGTLGVMELAGIPHPSKPPPAPTDVRTDGPYGFVRHPIYFAWLLLVWSVPVMNGTRLTFAAVSTFYLVIAVPFEERSLVNTFGPAYSRYQSQVRWKMLPFIY